jgi:hypothetical protein
MIAPAACEPSSAATALTPSDPKAFAEEKGDVMNR